jgi:hypothetical protein
MSEFWMQTHSGKRVDYLEPTIEQIDINDIAVHLSREGRFANATNFHYTVGQNAIYMCELAPLELKLEALLDDAEEAYTRDVPKPMKNCMEFLINQTFNGTITSPFNIVAENIKRIIRIKFALRNLNQANKLILKDLDNQLAITEDKQLTKNALMKEQNYLLRRYELLDFKIRYMNEIEVRTRFLQLFHQYKRTL